MMLPIKIAFLAFVWLVIQTQVEAKSIRLETPERTLSVKPGQETAEGTFVLENVSSKRLTIIRIALTCGCTQYQLSKNLLEPGEKAILTLVVSVAGKANELTVAASIFTDNAEETPEVATFKLKFPVLFTVQPRLLTWSTGEERTAKRVLVKKGEATGATSVVAVTTKVEGFEARLLPADQAGDFWVEITPNDTSSAKGAMYQLVLDSPRPGQAGLTIYAYIK